MGEILLLLALLSQARQQDEVQVSAGLNRSSAQVGDVVILTVTLRAPGLRTPEIEDPELEGLEVLAKNDRSTFRYSASLGTLRELSREYSLRVLQAGELTIPPIRAIVEGELYETEALRLVAEREGESFELPGGLGPRPEEEVAVRLWVEPETAYVGQQVTLTVGAFFDPLVRTRLQRQPEYRPPEVQGFWTADLPGSARPERRVVGRREYFIQIYRRALFPLSPGTIEIPPAAVTYEVRRGLVYAPETFQVESFPASVVVRPLPRVGVPPDYGGAVGRYESRVEFDRADLRAGEAVSLTLEVVGSGNLNSLSRPVLPEIRGVRAYESGEDAEVQLRGVEFAGRKRFYWVLVPERPGQYVVPQLRVPYFDPVEASYYVAETEPISLLVEAAPLSVPGTASGGAAIRFVRATVAREPLEPHRRPVFWLLQAIPLVLLGLVVGFDRVRRRLPAMARNRPQRRRRVLRDLRPAAASGDAAFFGQLRTRVLQWLSWRLHLPELPTQGVVKVQHALEDSGVPPPLALEVIELLDGCGRLRYAPDPAGSAAALAYLAKAEKLLAQVDREAVSEKRLRKAPGSGALALALIVSVAALSGGARPLPGQDDVEDMAVRWLQEGVAAYGVAEYAQAAQLFERALAARPRDPNLLYNLGNAYYELDRRGDAVAYWVRAIRIRPRDGDARFNLRLVVGEDPVLGAALPPLPLSQGELAALFTVLWFGGWTAMITRRRWRRGYLAFGGGFLLVLAALTATLLLYPRAEYAIVTSSSALVRAGPVPQSEMVASPAPGTGYRVQSERGNWLRVSRSGDTEGWIERRQVTIID
ncbi:MAG: BatD family protein [Gemmatimonadota bacterium]|nr:MAG: BatD family protein [Gemmatimonadota bacterium]